MPLIALEAAQSPLVLALDVGTSSVRSLLFDRSGDTVQGTVEQIEYDLTTTPDGGAYVDAKELLECSARCIDGTLARAGSIVMPIAAVGISCFWHSLLGVDTRGEPTTPVLIWADKRSADEVEELRATTDGSALRNLTGCVIHSSYWPAKLRWLAKNDPDRYSRTATWCAFSDYLLKAFTGCESTSVSMASGTGLLDTRAGTWAPAAIDIAGISFDQLPMIASDGQAAPGLVGAWVKRWPELTDAQWFPALGDGACANAGTGALTAERVALSLGTSGAMRIAIDCPTGNDFALPDDLWAYRIDHKRVVLGAAISNGGKVLAWLMELIGVELDDEALKLSVSLEPDGHGLTILPFLAGERSPIWNDRATAVIAGLTLSTGKAELLRAGMEAVSLRFARLYEGIVQVAKPRHEIVANGAAILKSPAWMQMTADALGHSLVALPADEESSARGAAVMALIHSGIARVPSEIRDPAVGAPSVLPIDVNSWRYEVASRRQRELERLLFPDGGSWESRLP